MYPISNEIIHDMMEEREKLEVRLAKEIENVFWELPLAVPLRKYMRISWEWLLQQADLNVPFGIALNGIIAKQGSLKIWSNYATRPSEAGLRRRIMPFSETWSPSDCSDLIRLWGEVIEDAPNPGVGRDIAELARQKKQSRDPIEFAKSEKNGHGGYRARADFPRYHPAAVPDHLRPLLRDAVSRGAQRCYLMPHDTIKKIDTMYGLPEGMAISGTTTDSIFFLDHMMSLLGALGAPDLMPALHLLPIATMVSRYHHTMLECAVALTIPPARKMDYYIGFYSSLMPHDVGQGIGNGVTTGLIGERLLQIMYDFEREARDTHLFAWTLRNSRRGVLFEAHELNACKALFSVRDKMSAWRAMSHTSTCAQAVNLWRRCCPTLPLPQGLVDDARRFGYHF